MPKVVDINQEIILAEEIHETLYLINAGANVNSRNKRGDTALFWAIYPEQTKLLIDAGADVNAQNIEGGRR